VYMYKSGIEGSFPFPSSPLLAACGSSTLSSAVQSSSKPTGEVSALLSRDENGNTGLEVSSKSKFCHADAPAKEDMHPSKPTSVLLVFAMKMRCFAGSHPFIHEVYR
jgi:hypothetical protein